ncbi:VTT domain-containing protein, partial [Candidatus Poribacteria bacterium]|nr:VTT domain-containing protein [Candidatus Poribacteria bacterium]MBT7096534.1 VTT domain-containing protein [Candidatus Poribacteria bacterium]
MTARKATTLVALALCALVGAYVVWFHAPEWRGLVKLCGYTVVSNVYISVLPHEPVLLFYGKTIGPFWTMVAATVGAFLSGVIDHETLTRVLNIGKVRKLYVDRKIYKVAARWYGKRPFLTIVVAAVSPVPFYPVKFLALSNSYPQGRYLLALVCGRAPRYFLYSWLGEVLDVPNWAILGAFGAMVLLGVVGKLRETWKRR